MARFHKNKRGEAAPCTAPPGQCPLGGDHFDTPEEVEAQLEHDMADDAHSGISKKNKGAQDNVEVYRHPQGKVATIKNGVLEVTKNGQVMKSSATIEKLRAGHGSWARDEASEDPTSSQGQNTEASPQLSQEELQGNYSMAQTKAEDAAKEQQAIYQRHREYNDRHAEEEGRRYYIGKDENGKIGRVYGQNPEPNGRHFVESTEEQKTELKDMSERRREALQDVEDRQTDIEEAGLGHTIPDEGHTIRVRSQAQKWLLKNELQGQISDGQWENASNNPWQDWSNAKVVVDPRNPGRNFNTRKDNYNLNSKALLDVVGDRMVDDVKTRTNRPDYNSRTMRADLADLKNVFKTKREPLA